MTEQRNFQTTSWSLVARAGIDAPDARDAVERLCRLYWTPLYAFLRGSGRSRSDAEDLVQGFFLHLLEHDVLRYANPARGRFRTFLITAVRQFASRQNSHDNAQKRRPATGLVSLDFGAGEATFERRGRRNDLPEELFDRVWAFTLLDEALNGLRVEYTRVGKTLLFNTLSPSLTSETPQSYRELAKELQLTEGAIRVAVHRLKQRYGTILRRHIAETVQSESEIDDELNALMLAIGR